MSRTYAARGAAKQQQSNKPTRRLSDKATTTTGRQILILIQIEFEIQIQIQKFEKSKKLENLKNLHKKINIIFKLFQTRPLRPIERGAKISRNVKNPK